MTTRRPPKAIAPSELAAILAFADASGDKAASKHFGVSERTLQRYRADLRAGRRPDLAALVAQQKAELTARHGDRLMRVYETALEALERRLRDEAPETRLKDRDLVGAIHILGNQVVTRQALVGDDDDEPAGRDRPGAGAAAGGAGAPAAAPGLGRAAIH